MELEIREEQSATVVTVSGRLDTTTAPDFEKRLGEVIQSGKTMLVLNMAQLAYISSAGLRVVLQVAKDLKASQGDIFLAGLKSPVKEIFDMSGFLTIFKSFETEEEALGNT